MLYVHSDRSKMCSCRVNIYRPSEPGSVLSARGLMQWPKDAGEGWGSIKKRAANMCPYNILFIVTSQGQTGNDRNSCFYKISINCLNVPVRAFA